MVGVSTQPATVLEPSPGRRGFLRPFPRVTLAPGEPLLRATMPPPSPPGFPLPEACRNSLEHLPPSLRIQLQSCLDDLLDAHDEAHSSPSPGDLRSQAWKKLSSLKAW